MGRNVRGEGRPFVGRGAGEGRGEKDVAIEANDVGEQNAGVKVGPVAWGRERGGGGPGVGVVLGRRGGFEARNPGDRGERNERGALGGSKGADTRKHGSLLMRPSRFKARGNYRKAGNAPELIRIEAAREGGLRSAGARSEERGWGD